MLRLGGHGVAGTGTGVIAIGTAATSISTTITISIVTTISTVTSIAKVVIGSTIHNTAAMRLTETGKQRTSLVVRVRVVQVAPVVPVEPAV